MQRAQLSSKILSTSINALTVTGELLFALNILKSKYISNAVVRLTLITGRQMSLNYYVPSVCECEISVFTMESSPVIEK